ncbi:MAG: MoaD/ThiS family protein [Candidatus Lambdaproteobacteria bacterium]|nr:MoaD/ThiS family protein [Candidatus Lambdaproteobacteria bacterium]
MNPHAAARSAAGSETIQVTVEAASYIAQFAGGTGSAALEFVETVRAGATVREVLRGLTARFPKLADVLWLGDEIGEHVEVAVNDAFLGQEYTLDSPVRAGDRIILIGQFTGG